MKLILSAMLLAITLGAAPQTVPTFMLNCQEGS